ncbi:MAG: nodulation protein NfeD [Actinomycetota bacterium]|nr:nodulation protein NfeD [Actinomycetota bacterium]
MTRWRVGLWLGLLLAGALSPLIPAVARAQETATTIDIVEVDGPIDPPTSDYLRGQIAAAQDSGTSVLIIQLDTPGGLDTSMREILQAELGSDVPIVVWVSPRGARAASAGTFIAYAAHLAYMAEATEIGAATPINLAGETSDPLETKITNDAVAFLREIATTRGRNADWAEEAIREGASIGATEAVRIDVVDGIASSLSGLLQALDGQVVQIPGGRQTLETWDESNGTPSAAVRFQNMNPIQKLLHAVTDPEVAFFLILLGAFGIIFELYNPGIGLAGILGAVSLLLGFYALSVLPTNWAGVLLVMLAVAFLLVDLHAAGFGVWTAGGVAALIAGGMLLFSGAPSAIALEPWAIVTSVAMTLVFFVSVMTAALRVRLRRPVTGEEGIVGTTGEAKTDIAPEGTVFTKGALWRARTMETGIAAGERVRIMATEGLVLLVEPLHEDHD